MKIIMILKIECPAPISLTKVGNFELTNYSVNLGKK